MYATDTQTTNPLCPSVCIIDDDDSVLLSISRLIRAAGWSTEVFGSASEFMQSNCFDEIDCIVLDMRMPGLTGLELHEWMQGCGIHLPVIFLTAYGDVSTSVRAMKHGAVDFLLKPVDSQIMLETIRHAIGQHAAFKMQKQEQNEISVRYARLTAREQEVMQHVVQGRLNKQIASDLGISLKTVKVHRARALEKMEVCSVAKLVHLCEKTGLLRT